MPGADGSSRLRYGWGWVALLLLRLPWPCDGLAVLVAYSAGCAACDVLCGWYEVCFGDDGVVAVVDRLERRVSEAGMGGWLGFLGGAGFL